MRLWHKDLIQVLPRKQLLGQWRECCLIAKNIKEKGTPGHILVNRILNYSEEHFLGYCICIFNEIKKRNYRADWNRLNKHICSATKPKYYAAIFCFWHDDIYLRQCLYNLEEKAMCGGISKDEWNIIVDRYGEKFDLWRGL